jgi:nucleoside-diphosphate-sugar epimerase
MRYLVTGPTGRWAEALTTALAAEHEVWGVARFSDAAARARLEAAGVHCVPTDLVAGTFDGVPDDVDYVVNLAVARTGDWDADLAANAETAGLLMAHCRGARAFLHCSSGSVYAPAGRTPLTETSPLGENSHRASMPTYTITKIAAEAVVRQGARLWNLPTTIARLNVPYGDTGGWPAFHLAFMRKGRPVPVHPDRPNVFNLLHVDDIVRQVPLLLEAATVPATVVNWASEEAVGVEEWCAHLGELTGFEPTFVDVDELVSSVVMDTTKLRELVGPTQVGWREGLRRLVEVRGLLASG